MEASDRTLMLRYQRGDRDAFAQLVRRYQTPVYNYVRRQVGAHLAEDIARQVFLSVVRESASFKEDELFSAWVFRIGNRLCRRERDRMAEEAGAAHAARARPLVIEGYERPSRPSRASVSLGPLSLEARSLEDWVVQALDGLSDAEREVFLLREVANLNFVEIAAVTGLSEAEVRDRLAHAFERLRMTLQDLEEYRRALR
jgi:RNA polymerase sigma-70 factor, ECF subfamily